MPYLSQHGPSTVGEGRVVYGHHLGRHDPYMIHVGPGKVGVRFPSGDGQGDVEGPVMHPSLCRVMNIMESRGAFGAGEGPLMGHDGYGG
jgi:hypothetical protein